MWKAVAWYQARTWLLRLRSSETLQHVKDVANDYTWMTVSNHNQYLKEMAFAVNRFVQKKKCVLELLRLMQRFVSYHKLDDNTAFVYNLTSTAVYCLTELSQKR